VLVVIVGTEGLKEGRLEGSKGRKEGKDKRIIARNLWSGTV
jgi:hypothetical protein